MTVPLISVIIPNYNYGDYIADAIESVLSQTYPEVEIIVVDDGSTDDSKSKVIKYGSRVRLVQQQNKGVSAARNRGIAESNGRFIAFLDADDKWHPEKLSRQFEQMNNPKVGMVYCGLQYMDAKGRFLSVNLSGSEGYVLKELALLEGPGVPASGSSALVRRECFERVGLFDESLSTSADWDMWRRIACHYEIRIVREPLVFYRVHASGMHHNVDLLERDMLQAVSKMFSDPDAQEVHHLRRRCYGNLYLMLSGSCLHARQWKKSIKYAAMSMLAWPPAVSYIVKFPMRHVKRFREGSRQNSDKRKP